MVPDSRGDSTGMPMGPGPAGIPLPKQAVHSQGRGGETGSKAVLRLMLQPPADLTADALGGQEKDAAPLQAFPLQ